MKNKRGQATLFIVFSILVVAGVALFFTFNSQSQGPGRIPGDSLNGFVNGCLESTSQEVVFSVAERGGHYNYDSSELSTNQEVPYYNSSNGSSMPSIEEIQKEISSGIENEIPDCIGDLSKFENYEVSGSPQVETSILKEGFRVDLLYPIKVQESSSSSLTKEFSYSSSLDIRNVYNSISSFIESNYGERGVCFTCMDEIMSENDLYSRVYFSEGDNRTSIIGVQDRSSELNDEYFEWVFAYGY